MKNNNRESPMRKPDYIKIIDELRKEIEDGVRPVGSALPSESELSERYSLSRPTVRKALSALERAGLIQRRPGVGSTVSDAKKEAPGKGRRLAIGIDFTNIGNAYYYYDQLVDGLNEILTQHDGTLRLLRSDEITSVEKGALDGVVIVRSNEFGDDYEAYAKLSGKGLPVIMINRFPKNASLGYVSVDYQQETRRIIARMLANGAKRVAMAGGSESIYVNFERAKGWRLAYQDAKLPRPDELAYDFNSSHCDFEGFAGKLKSGEIEAVFITQASLLTKTLEIVYKAGALDTPIVCFDDIWSFCELSELPISYVKMPLRKMGRIAAEHFAALRDDPSLPPPRLQLPISLVVKDCKYLL